ncbi:hypothetical protein [Propioniciclava flava]|uniref:Cobyrinic acid a,c-diamide synthase n=1 Tax=Propioniciclava flava TaxID=2072026 RepID=A0A4Q2END4_9ACTN|nr:hypothetical protein [Propioniciclava flava]RXW33625.1 hypothetical protein C1706_02430 [Propioniciclava flava]
MPRRVGLPGASELFRSTGLGSENAEDSPTREGQAAVRRRRSAAADASSPHEELRAPGAPAKAPASSEAATPKRRRTPAGVEHSGRVRHEEKITVYVSSEELLALERLRLELRAEHGLAVDRGRIVRAAIASALASIEADAESADVLQRLAAES